MKYRGKKALAEMAGQSKLKLIATWVAFAYGVYVFILYGLIAACRGAWIRGQTEKERLELLLGE